MPVEEMFSRHKPAQIVENKWEHKGAIVAPRPAPH